LCAVGGEVYGITEKGAEHSAEHGAVDDGDAVRKQQATIAVWRLLERNDTVLLRCVVSFL
jgi:predicted DCC family thiol-disulfide oxidoreductase YuxK